MQADTPPYATSPLEQRGRNGSQENGPSTGGVWGRRLGGRVPWEGLCGVAPTEHAFFNSQNYGRCKWAAFDRMTLGEQLSPGGRELHL